MAIRAGETPPRYAVAISLALLGVLAAGIDFFRRGRVLDGFLLVAVFLGMGWVFFPAIRNVYQFHKLKFQLIVIGGPLLYCLIDVGADITARRMDIYIEARRDLLESAVVKGAFGNDLRTGWPIDLNAEVSSQDGHAELDVPIRGNHAKGYMVVTGTKVNGIWTIDQLYAIQRDTKIKIEIKR